MRFDRIVTLHLPRPLLRHVLLPPPPEQSGGEPELSALPDVWAELCRRAFLLLSPFGIVACALGVLAQLPDVNPLDLWMLSALGGALLLAAALVWRRVARVEAALPPLYALAATYFVAMLGQQLALNVGREQRLSEAVFWFPVLYALAFLIWDLRRAIFAAALPLLACLATALTFVPTFAARGQWNSHMAAMLAQFFLAQGVLIALLAGFAFLKDCHARMRTLAYHDFLTGLPNRRLVLEIVTAYADTARAGHWSAGHWSAGALSVALFDLDFFKRVNDRFGHHVGDAVLREVAQVAEGFVRGGAVLARWGGEEFVLLLPALSEAEAARLAERVRAAIEGHVFPEVRQVTASFGVALRRENESFEDALKRADAALYGAKSGGRNQVVRASEWEAQAGALPGQGAQEAGDPTDCLSAV